MTDRSGCQAGPPQLGQGRLLPQALLGLVLETSLTGDSNPQLPVTVSSPWDLWWAAYRAAIPAGLLGLAVSSPAASCAACAAEASSAAAADPPVHPGASVGRRGCGCLLGWATRMRTPSPALAWPALPLTLALIKPGAPERLLRAGLARDHHILGERSLTLTRADVRRLYPEAYGADFVAAVDAYLTSAPVSVLVLGRRDSRGGRDAAECKRRLRQALGSAESVRNHLHMPDNPAEALADIAHLAGLPALTDLYERHARDGAPARLAFYRAALGIRPPRAHRHAGHAIPARWPAAT